MQRVLTALCCAAFTLSLAAQTPAGKASKSRSAETTATPKADAEQESIKDLPVRKVVLYKNGVGYFEHAGTVNGNQRVAIDFTSPQLNDVLQSLTVLDEGGGRITGVNYNSTTPLEEQLKSLLIGLDANPTFSKFLTAMRGARVEVRSGASTFTGRIMDIEEHKTGAGKDNDGMVEERFLTVVSDSGDTRIFPMTPGVDVRLVDAGLEGDVNRYLELLNTARSTGLRHLTLNAVGQGSRELQVSYISEVPVWKSTYRLVFPREADGNAMVQGWAVVDNTVGADWDDVQLSLVAGAPQSFIQPLSQPLYVRRPEIPIATEEQLTPQTHDSAEMMNNQLTGATRIPHNVIMPAPAPSGFGVAGMEGLGGSGSGGGIGTGTGNGYGPGYGGNVGGGLYHAGGVDRVSDAMRAGDVSTNAFDDFFEYTLTQPVTIHKNESAMVPILQAELPAEHVTLWSDGDAVPLRAVWLENKSKLTLDAGSFSIFENGEFAGEGLLEPIHPGEKRLLSYAEDQAVKVHRGGFADTRVLHHIAMHDGVMVEQTSEVTESTYTVTNAADEARMVIVEHARKPDAELDSDPKPAETTATAYRFRVAVDPHQSVDLHVGEKATLSTKIRINPENDRNEFLTMVSQYTPELKATLQPLIDAETALSDLNRKIGEVEETENNLAADEQRDRDNLKALNGNDAAKRFVEELNQAEDAITAARAEQAGLETQRDAAHTHLAAIIAGLSFDSDLSVVTQSTQYGDRPPQE